jgi:hypothetical protein
MASPELLKPELLKDPGTPSPELLKEPEEPLRLSTLSWGWRLVGTALLVVEVALVVAGVLAVILGLDRIHAGGSPLLALVGFWAMAAFFLLEAGRYWLLSRALALPIIWRRLVGAFLGAAFMCIWTLVTLS